MDWTVVRDDERYVVEDARLDELVVSRTSLLAGRSTRGHRHPHPETLFVVSGEGTLVLDHGTRISLTPGGFHAIPGGSHHRVETEPGIEFVCVFTGPRSASEYEGGPGQG